MSEALLKEIAGDVKAQGQTLAAINERTIQHEKRMNRADRHASGLGALAGAIAAGFTMFAKSFFPGMHS